MPTISTIDFKATLFNIGDWVILRLPPEASLQLPSRGQAMVEGSFNGIGFQTPLEPDGKFSHWFHVPAGLLTKAGVASGDTVSIAISPMKVWPDPQLPADLQKAINDDQAAHELWQKITPMARWEWLRWTRSSSNTETRQRRLQVAISKMNAGERRPCCWNRNLSTEPAVSKGGVLLAPEAAR